MTELEELRVKVEELKSWMKSANQFAWAHERSCPKCTGVGVGCNCGLDAFLGRPRPFIDSYKTQLEQANKQIQIWEEIAVWLLDCEAATGEYVLSMKSAAKNEKRRHHSICKIATESIASGELPRNRRSDRARAIDRAKRFIKAFESAYQTPEK